MADHTIAQRGPPGTRLTGPRHIVVRVLWIALAILTVATLTAATVIDHSYYAGLPAARGWTPDGYRVALVQLGLDASSLDAFSIVITITLALTFIGLSVVIFWQKPDDKMAIFVSAFLMTFSLTAAGAGLGARTHPLLSVPILFLSILGQSCVFLFLFIFPDGRFVPRWTRWPTIAAVALLLSITALVQVLPQLVGIEWFIIYFVVSWMFVSLPAQIYRYRRVSTLVQQQQTKMVVFGFALLLASGLAGWFVPVFIIKSLFPMLAQPSGQALIFDFITGTVINTFGILMLPLCIGVAILRSRLWDIDIIVRRTLVYSTLTLTLGLVYLGCILLTRTLVAPLTGGSELAIIISTLAIAALFMPLRRRIQHFIDRRFYRRKYDAAKVLAAFGVTARDETNLEALTAELLNVVDETMQPEFVGLWLRHTGPSSTPSTQPKP
jgi:hypothetical protein